MMQIKPLLRFGWDNQQRRPEGFEISLNSKLVRKNAEDTFVPTAELVKTVAQGLVRGKSTRRNGFVVIPDTRTLLGTKANVIAFQKTLMAKVSDYLKKHEPSFMSPQFGDDQSPNPVRFIADFPIKGYGRNEAVIYKGWRSIKRPHLDDWRYNVVSLIYGPFRNVKGGEPVLVDLKQFAKDQGIALKKVFEGRGLPQNQGIHYGRIHNQYLKPLIDKYTMKFDTLDFNRFPIVMFSNRFADGIAHGAVQPEQADPEKLTTRSLYHVGFGWEEGA